MTDPLTPEQRSRNMASVRGKDTKPEMTVRTILHRLGYRFRLHRPDLPGTPDLVFPSRRKVIFVHGCFWHVHDCHKGAVAPLTNAAFWNAKRQKTVERDRKAVILLAAEGWTAYIVWECELRHLDELQDRLVEFLLRDDHASH